MIRTRLIIKPESRERLDWRDEGGPVTLSITSHIEEAANKRRRTPKHTNIDGLDWSI
jgi:hypothetical protein